MTIINAPITVKRTVINAPISSSQRGPIGPQGEQGIQGDEGLSAYEVAVANGFVGTEQEWLDSLKSLPDFTEVAYPDSLKIGDPDHIATLQTIFNHMYSAGMVDGFDVTINPDASINVADGQAILRIADDHHSDLVAVSKVGENNIVLVDQVINYLILDYNGGNVQFDIVYSLDDFNCQNKCLIEKLVREGTIVHSIPAGEQNVDTATKMRKRIEETEPYKHVLGGSVLTEVGTRNIYVTEGAFWFGLEKVLHSMFDTSVSDVFSLYYRNSTGWTKLINQTQINNTIYDDGSDIPPLINNNYYSNRYVFIINNNPSSLAVQLGQKQYNSLSNALLEPIPDPPPLIAALGAVIARITVEAATDPFAAIGIPVEFKETFVEFI